MNGEASLTGVWNGMYSYTTEPDMPESQFTAVFFNVGGHLSGTIHEKMNYPGGISVAVNAHVSGDVDAGYVSFTKTYDGTGGATHSVDYRGRVNAARDEIEGEWSIAAPWEAYTGRFLMIRAAGPQRAAKARVAEKA